MCALPSASMRKFRIPIAFREYENKRGSSHEPAGLEIRGIWRMLKTLELLRLARS